MINLNALKYSKEHEWVHFSEDKKTATIGITDFAQNALGDIVFVELPETGTEVTTHQIVGAVESVKSVSDVYCPISGKIIDVNKDLNDQPELVNKDPYDKGWLFKIEISSQDFSHLLSKEDYEKIAV